jgi:hypothetical protein
LIAVTAGVHPPLALSASVCAAVFASAAILYAFMRLRVRPTRGGWEQHRLEELAGMAD